MKYESFPAMGTEVVAWGDEPSRVEAHFSRAEAIFSRFRADSELAALNAAPETAVVVSEPMAACLSHAADLRLRTGGLVDPAVGNAVVDWGYDTTFVAVTDLESAPSAPAKGDWSLQDRVLSRAPGTRLDLGGIAKGWTSDQAVEMGLAAVVSAGGDVRSNHPGTAVSIADPWGETVLQIRLGVGGLATSSTTRRRWKVGAAEASHIIDPRTLAPVATPIYSASVMAATAVAAEAGAKAVLLHGADGLAWAEAQPWIDAALAVWHDGSVYATTGWEMAA